MKESIDSTGKLSCKHEVADAFPRPSAIEALVLNVLKAQNEAIF